MTAKKTPSTTPTLPTFSIESRTSNLPDQTTIGPAYQAPATRSAVRREPEPPLGIFSPESLQRHIEQHLATIPPAHRFMVVGYYALDGSAAFTLVSRPAEGWTIGAVLSQSPAVGLSGGMWIQASWP